MAQRWSMHSTKLGVVIVCGMFVCGGPVEARLVDKMLAVVNGEMLTFQDFDDYLALSRISQLGGEDIDRQHAFQRFVEHALLRQEALRTRISRVDEAAVSQHLSELDQQPERREKLVRVMQERGLSQPDVRSWLCHQLIVRAFIDRLVLLFVLVTESQIVQYYQGHQEIIGVPLGEAVRDQIRRLLTDRQVNIRLTELIEQLRKKGILEFPP
jgi:hypothetical protein